MITGVCVGGVIVAVLVLLYRRLRTLLVSLRADIAQARVEGALAADPEPDSAAPGTTRVDQGPVVRTVRQRGNLGLVRTAMAGAVMGTVVGWLRDHRGTSMAAVTMAAVSSSAITFTAIDTRPQQQSPPRQPIPGYSAPDHHGAEHYEHPNQQLPEQPARTESGRPSPSTDPEPTVEPTPDPTPAATPEPAPEATPAPSSSPPRPTNTDAASPSQQPGPTDSQHTGEKQAPDHAQPPGLEGGTPQDAGGPGTNTQHQPGHQKGKPWDE